MTYPHFSVGFKVPNEKAFAAKVLLYDLPAWAYDLSFLLVIYLVWFMIYPPRQENTT